MEAFKAHGWPLSSDDLFALTNGAVNRTFLSNYRGLGHKLTVNIGKALEVPCAAMDLGMIPLSRNVASMLLSLTPLTVVDTENNRRLYRVCHWMQANGYGECKRTMTKHRVAVKFRLSDRGGKELEKIMRRVKKHEF
jgi:hypothetical protein